MSENESNRLNVMWTSADKEVALNMVFMYTLNSRLKGWWENVRLIVWGPSSKLMSEDAELQGVLKDMLDAGVDVTACKACADRYGVSDKLTSLGIEVKYMGLPLTDLLKADEKIITF